MVMDSLIDVKSRSQIMTEQLWDMQAAFPQIEASAIVSVDGLTMASALPADIEEDRISAISAALLSLGERISAELNCGALEQVCIKSEDGYVILLSVGGEAVLTAMAREQSKLGHVFLELHRTADALVQLI
jgi:predicted regulator of Ras-like GTPase activity (Roadblock/LC7/MglB family)